MRYLSGVLQRWRCFYFTLCPSNVAIMKAHFKGKLTGRLNDQVGFPQLSVSPFNSITFFPLPPLLRLCHDFCWNPPPMSSLVVIDDRKFRAGIGEPAARCPVSQKLFHLKRCRGRLTSWQPRVPFPHNRGRSTDRIQAGLAARVTD